MKKGSCEVSNKFEEVKRSTIPYYYLVICLLPPLDHAGVSQSVRTSTVHIQSDYSIFFRLRGKISGVENEKPLLIERYLNFHS